MSNEPTKIPDKKKNDLLKKFLNAQQYTKTLKKNAMHLIEDHPAHSYDEIQSYPEIPQSAKLPSIKAFSKQLMSTDTIKNNDSHDFSDKPKIKKSHGYQNMTQSSSEIPHMKNKKSSYSEIEKSENSTKGIKGDVNVTIKSRTKEYDVQSMKKEKLVSEAMHGSTGATIKTDSFFKPKSNIKMSNLHQFESQKLSAQDDQSVQNSWRCNRGEQKPSNNKRPQSFQQSPYNLSPTNFIKLINKVQQLQGVITMYQSVIEQLKKKILSLQQEKNTNEINQFLLDSVKEELQEENRKNAQLREIIGEQESWIKQYQKGLIETVEKIGKFYQTEISKVTILQKENQFLKFLLRLQMETPYPETYKIDNKSKGDSTTIIKDNEEIPVSFEKLSPTRNLTQFREKFINNKNIESTKNTIVTR